jgi:hypothetical protein
MAIHTKVILAAALGGAALLGGCATGPYYDNGYGYGYGYDTAYPGYYDPYSYGPSVGLGFSYSDNDYRWRDNDGRWRNNDGRWRDRGDRAPRIESRTSRDNNADIRNNNGAPMWSQGDTYRGTGPSYDPQKDHGQYSPG